MGKKYHPQDKSESVEIRIDTLRKAEEKYGRNNWTVLQKEGNSYASTEKEGGA